MYYLVINIKNRGEIGNWFSITIGVIKYVLQIDVLTLNSTTNQIKKNNSEQRQPARLIIRARIYMHLKSVKYDANMQGKKLNMQLYAVC